MIYVHIPFCHGKCAYCDFYSMVPRGSTAAYIDAVEREWNMRRHELDGRPVRTIYFGGGTPSILAPEAIARLAELFPRDTVEEFTLEANPEDVTPRAVAAWCRAGIDRVSIGVQSLVDSELRTVGRRHTADEALGAIRTIYEGGIHRISADLIYGLPGQSLQSWQHSVDTLLATEIEHLSAYSLIFEPGTALTRQLERGLISEAPDELIEDMYTYLCRKARAAGMEHYEISAFARPGAHSRHNSAYWDGTPYLGLGPGAHSLGTDGVRRYNRHDLQAYLANPSSTLEAEDETADDRIDDLIITALRTAQGLDTNRLPNHVRAHVERMAAPYLATGRLIRQDSCLIIPEEAWLISDAIMRDLMV